MAPTCLSSRVVDFKLQQQQECSWLPMPQCLLVEPTAAAAVCAILENG